MPASIEFAPQPAQLAAPGYAVPQGFTPADFAPAEADYAPAADAHAEALAAWGDFLATADDALVDAFVAGVALPMGGGREVPAAGTAVDESTSSRRQEGSSSRRNASAPQAAPAGSGRGFATATGSAVAGVPIDDELEHELDWRSATSASTTSGNRDDVSVEELD